MFRLVSIPDAVLDRDDLAAWLIMPPATMGFGYLPRFRIRSVEIHPIFEDSIVHGPIFESTIEQGSVHASELLVNEYGR